MTRSKVKFHEHPFIKQVRGWLQVENWNWICLVCGDTGSGKSRASISLADAIDRDPQTLEIRFTRKQILKDPTQFFNSIISVLQSQVGQAEQQGDKLYFRPGTCIVLEEMGSQMASRDAMKGFNKALSKLFQTFRRTNLGVIGNLPYLKMVDVDVRRLAHAVIKCDRKNIDKTHMINYARLFKIIHDPVEGHPRLGYFRIKPQKNALPQRLTKLPIPNPRTELVQAYETMDAENKLNIAEQALHEMQAARAKEQYIANKWLERADANE